MNCALGQWLGNWFDESTKLVSVEITLPDYFPILDSTVEFEKISKITIPAKYIKYLQDE